MVFCWRGVLSLFLCHQFGQVGCGNTEDQNSPQLVNALVDQVNVCNKTPGSKMTRWVAPDDCCTKSGCFLLLQTVTIVQCGWRHTIAMTDRGNVYSWGRGTSGQLGHGDAVDRYKSFFLQTGIYCRCGTELWTFHGCVYFTCRATPKRVEILSADGYACEQIESSGSTNCTSTEKPFSQPPCRQFSIRVIAVCAFSWLIQFMYHLFQLIRFLHGLGAHQLQIG
jgi:alpha-tubulin suppressor-like RCC1 family protein